MSASPLHPNLQRLLVRERRVTRCLSLIVFLPLAGCMLFAMTAALRGNTLGDLLFLAMIAGIVLVLVVTMGGLLAWLHQRTVRRVLEAQHLLLETPPLAVRLQWTGRKTLAGWVVALEHLEGTPLGYASIQTILGQRQPQQVQGTAQLHCEQQQNGTRLVILQEGHALLGRWVNAQAAAQQRRWMLAGGLLALAVLVLLTTFATGR